jgi:hypothetical protein
MGNAGYVHWAKQAAKGTANTADGQRVYVLDTDWNVTDLTRMQRPTIGAAALPQGAYKAGTGGGGVFNLEVCGENIGYLLYFLCGDVSVSTGSPETAVTDTHVFKMATDEFSLPWVTFIEDKDDAIKTQLADCVVVGAQFVFAAADSLQARFTVVGTTPSFATDPTTPDDDNSPILVNSIAAAAFEVNAAPVDAQQIIVDMTNIVPGLAEEMKIGSPFRRDISKLARDITLTIRNWVDATWWKEVYFGGGTAWSAAPYQDDMSIKAASGSVIPGASTTPYSIQFDAAEATFGPCRAPVAARRITIVETTGVVGVPSAGEDFSFTLVTDDGFDFTTTPT